MVLNLKVKTVEGLDPVYHPRLCLPEVHQLCDEGMCEAGKRLKEPAAHSPSSPSCDRTAPTPTLLALVSTINLQARRVTPRPMLWSGNSGASQRHVPIKHTPLVFQAMHSAGNSSSPRQNACNRR